MIEQYKTINATYTEEIKVKKSRFICTLIPITSEDEAKAHIDSIKKEYYNANHSCSAYRIGKSKILERYADDGEPSGTAGMPMLEVLRGEGVTNVLAVVTRYFGGTLLGTGGLVRAYTDATKAAFDVAVVITKKMQRKFLIDVSYTLSGKVEYLLHQQGYEILNTNYGEGVTYEITVDASASDACIKAIRELTSDQFEYMDDGLYYTYKDHSGIQFEIV